MADPTRERMLLPADFDAPAADILSSPGFLREFEQLKAGFESWRVRIALLDVLNLCHALERWLSSYEPPNLDAGEPMDWEPFSQLKACIDFAYLYFAVLNEQCLGASKPVTVTSDRVDWISAARRLDPPALSAARGVTKWRHKVIVHPNQEMRFSGGLGKGLVRMQFSNFYEGYVDNLDLGSRLGENYGVSLDVLDRFELMGRAFYAVPVFVEGVEGINPDRQDIEDRTGCRGIASLSTGEIVQVVKRYTWAWREALAHR
jgi:hypothetical protein